MRCGNNEYFNIIVDKYLYKSKDNFEYRSNMA